MNRLQAKLISTFLIAVFLTFSCFQAMGQSNDLNLSQEGQTAYQTLLNAPLVEDKALGFAATPSELIKAFRILLKERQAQECFKSLLEKATLAGQLYALCGLYFTDYDFFLSAIEKYRQSDKEIVFFSGCIRMKIAVSDFIESKSPNVVRLNSPQESLEVWKSKQQKITNENGYVLDIIGGGYPNWFRDN